MAVHFLCRRFGIRIALFVLSLVVSACSSVEYVRGPDGTPHRLIRCRLGVKDCYEKAEEVCGNYRVVQETGQATGHTDERSAEELALLIKCEK